MRSRFLLAALLLPFAALAADEPRRDRRAGPPARPRQARGEEVHA
ncbi:MAG: hypothetical protein ACKOIB_11130 [Verrucomicrobiota bacterium]